MNCREFTIVFEDHSGLSEAATLHLKICAECQKLSREQTRVWQMIEAMPRAAAPQDFDFRVRARIADAKPNNFQPRFLPVLRYALPLCAIVLILGFVVFKTMNFTNDSSPQIAQTNLPSPIQKEATKNNPPTIEQNVAEINSSVSQPNSTPEKLQDKPMLAEAKSSQERRGGAKTKIAEKENIGGGSRDSAVTRVQPNFPSGLSPTQANVSIPNLDGEKTLSVSDALSFLGIESDDVSGKIKVKAVKQNSLAERSDVRVGDVIEAIDGRKISPAPLSEKSIEGKTLTVLRGTERIVINLRN